MMFRISLRQLFILVAVVALAIVSLKYASTFWEATIYGVALAVFFIAAIVALVDRGPRQAFAIGLTVILLGYAILYHNEKPATALHLGMPTNALLMYAYMHYPNLFPSTEHVFQIAHCWWALVLGYLGGHIARFIYVRRMNDQTASPKD
jgi:hypothetical protein